MKEMIGGFTSDILEKCPVQMAHMGLVIARWAYVEQAMAFFYDYLLAQKEEPREFGWPVDGLGVASFSAVRSVRTKIELLSLAVEWRLGDEALDEFIRVSVKKVEIASRARNVIAHGIVSTHESRSDVLVFYLNGQDVAYTTNDFVSVLDKIAEAYESVVWFHNVKARSLLQSS